MELKSKVLLLATISSSLFVGCSKNGSSGATAANGTYVSGYAATGAAIAGGKVDLIDSEGNQATSATTSSDGSYKIEVGGKKLPYILKVTTSAGKEYMSAISDEAKLKSTINISPLTHTVVARMLGETDPTEAFKKIKLADGASEKIDLSAKVTTTAMNTQTQAINTALANVIAQVDSANTAKNYDFFNGSFTPGSGQKMDALLDAIKIDSTDKSKIVIKLKADESKTIDVPKDVATNVGPALSSTDVLQVNEQITALTEIKSKIGDFGVAIKDACLNYNNDTKKISTLESYFDNSYLHDGEDKLAYYKFIWEEECEEDRSNVVPVKFANINIDKINLSTNIAEVSYDILVDGKIVHKGEKDLLKKFSDGWKLYGNQFPYYIEVMPRVNINSSFVFNGSNVGSSGADEVKTGLDLYLEAKDCSSIDENTLTLAYGSTTLTLKCTTLLGGIQLVDADKLYTDGNGHYSPTPKSGYSLNYNANNLGVNFDNLGAETEMRLDWNNRSKKVVVHKPDSTKHIDFNKTAAQLCSGTTTPDYGFIAPEGSRIKSSMIAYSYKTSLSGAITSDSNFNFDDTDNGLSVGTQPKSSVPNGAQFVWKNIMVSAYDEFNRAYTKMLNCSGYNYDESVTVPSITYFSASAFNHTWINSDDPNVTGVLTVAGSNGTYTGTFSGTAAGDQSASTPTSGSCNITITQTSNTGGTITASSCTYETNNGPEVWSLSGNQMRQGGDTFHY